MDKEATPNTIENHDNGHNTHTIPKSGIVIGSTLVLVVLLACKSTEVGPSTPSSGISSSPTPVPTLPAPTATYTIELTQQPEGNRMLEIEKDGRIVIPEAVLNFFRDLSLEDLEDIRNDPENNIPEELRGVEFGREIGLVLAGARFIELHYSLTESRLANFSFYANNEGARQRYIALIQDSPMHASEEDVSDENLPATLALTVFTSTGTEAIVFLENGIRHQEEASFRRPNDSLMLTGADERIEMECIVQTISNPILLSREQDYYISQTHGLMSKVVNSRGEYLGSLYVWTHNAAVAWIVRVGNPPLTSELFGKYTLDYVVLSRAFGYFMDKVGITREEVLNILQTGNIVDLQDLIFTKMGIDPASVPSDDFVHRWQAFKTIEESWNIFLAGTGYLDSEGNLLIDQSMQVVFSLLDYSYSELRALKEKQDMQKPSSRRYQQQVVREKAFAARGSRRTEARARLARI
ncbi:hypothetical protein JW766_01590 [Candidatus Dojkabacteria bacterium]|nr:hypothetical protein [Candidatus Dojkabacteria bacterium]